MKHGSWEFEKRRKLVSRGQHLAETQVRYKVFSAALDLAVIELGELVRTLEDEQRQLREALDREQELREENARLTEALKEFE